MTPCLVFHKRCVMKMMKTKKPVVNNFKITSRLRNLKAGSDDCIVLETASEHRNYGGAVGLLKRKHKMEFSTRNGDNGTVLVWRVK